MTETSNPFADLVSDLDADGGTEVLGSRKADAPPAGFFNAKTRAKLARFPCRKCGGTGRFRGVQVHIGHNKCFTCGGSGLVKTDPEVAARRRAAKEQKRLLEMANKIAAWNAAHPREAEWLGAHRSTDTFAASLCSSLGQYGSLTDNQTAAIGRSIDRAAARVVERAERKPDASVAGDGFTRMIAAFGAASAAGLKHPKFTVAAYVFKPAKAHSSNAGCIYVTRGGTYLGRITAEGGYFATREATAEDRAEVARIGADPLAAATMHGKATGSCSCCGRALENAESVALGIGPICRAKWGLQ